MIKCANICHVDASPWPVTALTKYVDDQLKINMTSGRRTDSQSDAQIPEKNTPTRDLREGVFVKKNIPSSIHIVEEVKQELTRILLDKFNLKHLYSECVTNIT